MVNIIDLKREINHILGDKSTEYFKLLTLYFSGRIEKGTGFIKSNAPQKDIKLTRASFLGQFQNQN